MIRLLQLLTWISILNGFLIARPRIPLDGARAHWNRRGHLADAVTTFSFNTDECVLRPVGVEPVHSRSTAHKLLETMRANQFDSPQCFVSPKKSHWSLVSCYCAASFFHKCVTVDAMAESVYEWRRDPESRAFGSRDGKVPRNMKTVDCVLDAFEKIPPGEGSTSFSYSLTAGSVSPQSRTPPAMARRAGNGSIQLSVECLAQPTLARITIHCNDDQCQLMSQLQVQDGLKTFHVPLQVFLHIQEVVANNDTFSTSNCPNLTTSNGFVSRLRSEMFHVIEEHLSLAPRGNDSLLEFGKSRLTWRVEDRNENAAGSSLALAYSFVLAVLFLAPYVSFSLIAFLSRGDVDRVAYPAATTDDVKLIEEVLADQQRPAHNSSQRNNRDNDDELNPDGAASAAAMTTMSQMGNMTDLGSECLTGTSQKTHRLRSNDDDLKM